MANFNVEVIVNPAKAIKGSRQSIRALGKVEAASDRLRNSLRNTFTGIGFALVIREIVKLTDTFTNLQNRLRVVTADTSQLEAVTNELFDISRKTRSSFEGTVELYSRLAISAKELGVSQKELTQFTKSMNEAIILSGASGREANAGLIQLSQGIASGALRGDELRSVLEQLPIVADVIAKQMKVTRGELRALGATGAITANLILEAFKNSREELQERFGKTIPTISQSFQVLRNSLVFLIGNFNKSNGAAKLFSGTLLTMADNMETLLRSAGALAITLGITLATQAIPKVITAIKALTAAMAANPFGLLVIAIAGVIGYLVSFGDQLKMQEGKLATFQDFAIIVWRKVAAATATFINWFQENFGVVASFASKVFGSMEFSIAGFLRFAANKIDRYIGLWIGAYNVILAVWKQFPSALQKVFSIALNAVINTTENGVNRIVGLINKLFIAVGAAKRLTNFSVGRLSEGAYEGVNATGKALKEAFEKGFDFKFFQDGVDNLLNDAEKLALSRPKVESPEISSGVVGGPRIKPDTGISFSDILRGLNTEIALLKLSSQEREIQEGILKIEKKLKRELTEAEDALADAALRTIQSLTLQNELYEQIRGPVDEYKESLIALNALLAQGKINQDELNLAMQQTQLGGALRDVQSDLGGEDEGAMMALEMQLQERNVILQQAREANLIQEQEYLDLSLEANKAYNQAVIDVEDKRLAMQLGAAASTFKSLSTLAMGFAGEQGKAYDILFGISKAFAIADTSVQIANALGKAANNPWPANLAAMAQVASLTAGLVGTISGTQFSGGFKDGGDFTVGGSGAADSQTVAFKATPGEIVSIRTPTQVREADRKNPSPNNFEAIEQLASITSGLVGAIKGTQFAGEFKTGGDFTVGGSGAADSQMVAFRATPGEQVSVKTPSQTTKSLLPEGFKILERIASVTAGLVGNMPEAQFAGEFKNGGDFTVGGSGSPDSQMVSFKATPGEKISVRTPSQSRNGQSENQPQSKILEQTIINTINPDDVMEAASDDVFINKMERNQDAMKNIISG